MVRKRKVDCKSVEEKTGQDMFPGPGTVKDRPGKNMVKARKMEKKRICFQ